MVIFAQDFGRDAAWQAAQIAACGRWGKAMG